MAHRAPSVSEGLKKHPSLTLGALSGTAVIL